MIRPVFIFLLCCLCQAALAQREAYNWFFGQGAGLSFSQSPPQPVLTGALYSEEGCASISDGQGRLLFYSNGTSLTNRAHQGMKNGTGLSGDQSSTQGVLIVPQPGVDSLYYVFTNGAVHMLLENGLKYSVVNIRGDNGMGEVVQKNVPLLTETYERIAAVRHCNNQDIWIVVRRWESDQYYAYLLTSTGLNPTPVISSTGNVIGGDINNNIGGIKFSSKGTRLACAFGYSLDRVELLDFNRLTGRLTNPVMFRPNITATVTGFPGAYGLEFSPTNDFLYVNSFNDAFDSRLYQFQVTGYDPALIEASRQLIHTEISGSGAGSIQVGPDGKLYVAYRGKSAVSVIEAPDNAGAACRFMPDGVILDPSGRTKCSAGFPNNLQSYFDNQSYTYAFERSGNCSDLSVPFQINIVTGIDSVFWDFGDGGSSTQFSPVHTFSQTGFHDISLRIFKQTCSGNSQLINKRIWIADTDDFLDPVKSFCPSGTVLLESGINDVHYNWNTGSFDHSIEVDQAGLYWLELEYNGCRMRDSTQVNTIPPPVITLGADSPVCSLKPVTLDPGDGFDDYRWSTGDSSRTLQINKPGTYSVMVTVAGGCSASDTVNLYPGDCGLFLPSAFTPNSDGLNDLFGPVDLVQAGVYNLSVYNRYGQPVFQSNDPAVKWNGTSKGKPLPAGVYIYILRMQQPGRSPQLLRGTVVLFR